MTMQSTRRLWIVWFSLGLALYLILFALSTLIQPFGERGRLIVGDVVYLLAGIAAGVTSLVAARAARERRLRAAWALIGAGFLALTLADGLYAWREMLPALETPPPFLMHALLLSFYILLFGGMLCYPTPRWSPLRRAQLFLDMVAVTAGAGTAAWYYYIAPRLAAPGSDLDRVVTIAYPLGDIILVWVLLRLGYSIPASKTRRTVFLLLAGVAALIAADVVYAGLTRQGLYRTGHPVEILWALGSLFIAAGALTHRRTPDVQAADDGHEQVAPRRLTGHYEGLHQQCVSYLALLGAFALLIRGVSVNAPEQRQLGMLIGASTVLCAILLRQLLTIAENTRLNRKLLAFSSEMERRVAERTAELERRVEEVTWLNNQVECANKELQHMYRLKSEFIANVSHELRTPLSSILGYTELLLSEDEPALSAFQSNSLRVVYTNGQRLLNLVDDLLDVSRMESGKFAIECGELQLSSDFKQLVEEAALTAKNKKVVLESDIPDTLPILIADGRRVGQVLNNLLSNAIKFTPAGGRIRVSAFEAESFLGEKPSVKTVGSSVQLPDLPVGRWLVTMVEDTGMGIAPEDMPHLFDRFYRTQLAQINAIPGTGLGLSVAKTIVEAHGGHIGVESCVNEGSRFWFGLPL